MCKSLCYTCRLCKKKNPAIGATWYTKYLNTPLWSQNSPGTKTSALSAYKPSNSLITRCQLCSSSSPEESAPLCVWHLCFGLDWRNIVSEVLLPVCFSNVDSEMRQDLCKKIKETWSVFRQLKHAKDVRVPAYLLQIHTHHLCLPSQKERYPRTQLQAATVHCKKCLTTLQDVGLGYVNQTCGQ